MTSTHKIADVVAFIARDDLDPEQVILDIDKSFPGITVEEVEAAFAVYDREADARMAETEAEHAAWKCDFEEMRQIFAGCPADTSLRTAVAIKINQGDPLAVKWAARLNSRSYRLREELLTAAHAVHPLFEDDGRWIGKRMMPTERERIEWFKLNYPASASEIERAIEQEVDDSLSQTPN
jgi:hypothetical protein